MRVETARLITGIGKAHGLDLSLREVYQEATMFGGPSSAVIYTRSEDLAIALILAGRAVAAEDLDTFLQEVRGLRYRTSAPDRIVY